MLKHAYKGDCIPPPILLSAVDPAMNEKGKWTPGPWIVKETRDGMTIRRNRRRLEIVAPEPGGGEMVVVGQHTGLDCLRFDNARLIASAPDLLKAAKLALDVLAVQYEDGTGTVNADTALHAFGNLREAIERAEGREGQ